VQIYIIVEPAIMEATIQLSKNAWRRRISSDKLKKIATCQTDKQIEAAFSKFLWC
jgi:hypothetical protein